MTESNETQLLPARKRSRLSKGLASRRTTRVVSAASGAVRLRAAQQQARLAGQALHRVDLCRVVSKYLGQTQQNIRRILDKAERADAILFFDEADSLFGKRADVQDAHDRYANAATNYLLSSLKRRGMPVILGKQLRKGAANRSITTQEEAAVDTSEDSGDAASAARDQRPSRDQRP